MDFGKLPLERASSLDRLCDRFEAEWRAGACPKIEDHLEEVPASEAPTLLGILVGIELELRFDRGERPLPSEYQRRFPGHAQLIDTAFAREAQRDRRRVELSRASLEPEGEDLAAASGDRRADGRVHRADTAAPHGQMLEFIVGSGERPTAIASLLSKRLRFLVWLIAALFFALILLVDLPKYWTPQPTVTLDGWLYIRSHSAMAVVAIVLGLVLRFFRISSLARLRGIEIILFAALCAEFSWIQWHEFHDPRTRLLKDVSGIAASAASLGWFVIIVFYGTFIPNHWRRCAWAVSLIALCPFATAAVASATTESVRWFVFGPFLVYLTLWMTLAVAIVIFGAHRIDTLQQEAIDARQLGRYHLRWRLNSGGMGDVYLGEHMLLRRPCAIKLIRPELHWGPNVHSPIRA